MNVRLYMDVHVRRAVTVGLRLRGIDVLTAQDDGTSLLEDPELLDRATSLDRVLFTQDEDLLRETKRRQLAGEHFAGVVYCTPTQYHDRRMYRRLGAHRQSD